MQAFIIARRFVLIDFLVNLVAAHLADGILQHGVLLIEVVYGFLALGVIVHGRLEEETQEALYAVAAGTGGQIAKQAEVKTQRGSEDRVAAQEIDLDLHGIAHPSEDVDVVPTFFVVVAWGIIVDANLMIILGVLIVAMTIQVGLYIWLQYGREL